MKKIHLQNSDKYTLVDDEDYDNLIEHKWYLSNGYVCFGNGYKDEGFKSYERMHRVILKARKGEVVDHINRDKLDNRRSNLRIVTHRQNTHNRAKRRGTKNNYKGVVFVKNTGLYQARSRINGRDYFLGYFTSEVAAAYAYNKKVIQESPYVLINNLSSYNKEYLEDILISHRRKTKKHVGSKYKYIGFRKKCGRMACDKFLVCFKKDGKKYQKGYFNTEDEALEYLLKNYSDIVHDAGALKPNRHNI